MKLGDSDSESLRGLLHIQFTRSGSLSVAHNQDRSILELRAAQTEFANLNKNNCWKDTGEIADEGKPEDKGQQRGSWAVSEHSPWTLLLCEGTPALSYV